MILQFTFFISSSKSYQNITTKLSSFLWITWRQFQITATRTRYLCRLLWIACENGRHFAPLVALRNEVWGPSAEVPCWRRVASVSNWLKICFSVCSVTKCWLFSEAVLWMLRKCHSTFFSLWDIAENFPGVEFFSSGNPRSGKKNIVSCLCSASNCKDMFGKVWCTWNVALSAFFDFLVAGLPGFSLLGKTNINST